MRTVSDLPSPFDIGLLEQVLSAPQLNRDDLSSVLCVIDRALKTHAEELERFGGPLTREEEMARPSLAREAERVRRSVTSLSAQSLDLTERVETSRADWTIRRHAQSFLESLHRLRNAEAGVKLESVVMDIGAGD